VCTTIIRVSRETLREIVSKIAREALPLGRGRLRCRLDDARRRACQFISRDTEAMIEGARGETFCVRPRGETECLWAVQQ
jgi:hypothetical protein